MLINLSKLICQPSLLEGPIEVDAHKDIADLLWKECAYQDIRMADFAMRLFNSNGEMEITPEEYKYIERIFPKMKYWLSKAIIENIYEKKS